MKTDPATNKDLNDGLQSRWQIYAYMHQNIIILLFPYILIVLEHCPPTLSITWLQELTVCQMSICIYGIPLYSETAWIEGSNIFGNNFQIFYVWDGLTVIVCKQFCTRDGLAAIQLRKEVNRCSCLHLTITHYHLSVMDLLFSPCNYCAHHCKYSTQMLWLNTIYV